MADGGQMVQTLRTAEPTFRLRATSSAERDAEAVQRAWAEPTGLDVSSAPSQVHGVLRSSGRPLDHGVRSRFERRLGQDFANVRVHSDESATAAASAVAANAFTCVAITPYPAKECDKEYFKLMARWNDANRPG